VAWRKAWLEQVRLSVLLDKGLPEHSFWTATDPVAPSATSGAMRKKRGVKPGVPDVLVWYCGKSIAVELKSRHGQCSQRQHAVREGLLRAGAQWWVCRSAKAAMWALGSVSAAVMPLSGPLWQRLPKQARRLFGNDSFFRGLRSRGGGRERECKPHVKAVWPVGVGELAVRFQVNVTLHVVTGGKDVADLRANADDARFEGAQHRRTTLIWRELFIEVSDKADQHLLGQKL
jgi:hypothetical protein